MAYHGFASYMSKYGKTCIMSDQKIVVPVDQDKITVNLDRTLKVFNHSIIAFIEGDGIGVDITPAMKTVVDAAVLKAW